MVWVNGKWVDEWMSECAYMCGMTVWFWNYKLNILHFNIEQLYMWSIVCWMLKSLRYIIIVSMITNVIIIKRKTCSFGPHVYIHTNVCVHQLNFFFHLLSISISFIWFYWCCCCCCCFAAYKTWVPCRTTYGLLSSSISYNSHYKYTYPYICTISIYTIHVCPIEINEHRYCL